MIYLYQTLTLASSFREKLRASIGVKAVLALLFTISICIPAARGMSPLQFKLVALPNSSTRVKANSKLVFLTQPLTSAVGKSLGSSVKVALENSDGKIETTASVSVTLQLVSPSGRGNLSGVTTVPTLNGIATFGALSVNTVGENYLLTANAAGFASISSDSFSITPASNGSVFNLPAQNQCDSQYDHYYENEPGVYAYWGLCEKEATKIGYDYLGQWPLLGGIAASPEIVAGPEDPLNDGETAAQAPDAEYKIENEGITLNKNAGSLAIWINGDAGAYALPVELFQAATSSGFVTSNVGIKVVRSGSSLCFLAVLTNSSAEPFQAEECGYTPYTWHRVALTWNSGLLVLYVDGYLRASHPYTGTLDDAVFTYQVFPGCCVTGKHLSLAKALISNEAWNSSQALSDYEPAIATPPASGVYVTTTQLGEIHKDVLGFADNNQNVSTGALTDALSAGIKAASFNSIRYAGGFGGIQADAGDWRHGTVECTQAAGKTQRAQNIETSNNIDVYVPEVTVPTGMSIGYTVNYGSNPPQCNAGGDPMVNGAALVQYANIEKKFGIKYWEIGNEQFAYGGSLIDLHTNPYLNGGSSLSTYPANEPSFYTDMKAVDPSIQIAVPAAVTSSINAMKNYEFPTLLHAKYDAVAFHTYPIEDPVSDGATLYQERVAAGTQIRGRLLAMQTQLLNAGKPKDAIWVTEWDGANSQVTWSKQTMGAVEPLFAATELAEFMQTGVQYATWWEQGMTDVCSGLNFDGTASQSYNWWSGCGNVGLVYTGPVMGVDEENVGLKPGDVTPAARGFQVLAESGIVAEGEHMVQTYTDTVGAPWLKAYAATHGDSYAVILINRDRDASHVVPVSMEGASSGSSATQWTYGRAQYDESYFGNWSAGPVTSTAGSWKGSYDVTLPPWSVNVVVFTK